ncbi:MAG: class I SAM-dependent methyltransferase [Hormoscilla sp. GM102CHS1]|nr:class I SAM-dependent methyltransferase [Hormoscilla sp. GM102CHS1]
MKQEVLKNYAKAVAIGAYDLHSAGLFGKHDNVRRHWEDRFSRNFIGHFISPLVASKRQSGTGIRVLDLGCGAGEGLNILTSLPQTQATLDAKIEKVLDYQDISCYKGLDISPAMIDKAKDLHRNHLQAEFAVTDLKDGLQLPTGELAYDIYFSSYGSLSHLNDSNLATVLSDICDHMEERAIFVGDFLGRYSYEWPCYWESFQENGSTQNIYSMSYIYGPDPGKDEVEQFPIRYWGGEELDRFVSKTVASKGVKVYRRRLCDRSILVGRHMDTREYNPDAPPIRAAVNSLHETNCRTDLSQLIFEYKPHGTTLHLNRFFYTLQDAWNSLVYACMDALAEWRNPPKLVAEPLVSYQPVVQQAIRRIRHGVQQAPEFHLDDPRSNLIEPQLAFLLRDLEWNLQQGLGAAHSILGVYEFHKVE